MFESTALFLKDNKVHQRLHRDVVERYEREIKDPVLRKKLTPNFALGKCAVGLSILCTDRGLFSGCRRLTPSSSFLKAVQQPNVDLNTDLIDRCVEDGVIINNTGEHRKFDAIIYATGYDSTIVPVFPVVGRDGVTMESKWGKDLTSYLGIATRGFPNYFVTLGTWD